MKENTPEPIPQKINCHSEKCPVCNGFGSVSYGKLICKVCKGRCFIIVPNDIPVESPDDPEGNK